MTQFYVLIPYCRVFLGDTAKTTYADDTILEVLRVVPGFLEALGWDKNWTVTWNGIVADLTEREKVVVAKACAILLRYPKALETAATAVSVRTEEVAYSTETAGRLVRELSAADVQELRRMIVDATDVIVARPSAFGLQLGVGSPLFGADPVND